MKDLIIIGASAAGVSAGVYAARRKLDFEIVSEDFGGEMAKSGEIGNWPSTVETTGVELTEKFRAQAEANDITIKEAVKITAVIKNNDGSFTIKGEKNGTEYNEQAKAVLVATGVHPRHLDVPGEEKLRNKGLSYCTVCDGPLFGDKVVAIIGGGNSALESAIMMSEIAEKVYVINKNPAFKGDEVLIDKVTNKLTQKNVELIYNALTQEIKGDDFVTGLTYKDTETDEEKELEVEGIFVHIGMIPNSTFLPDELEKNDYGNVKVDMLGKTNIEGLFVAGDVTSMPYNQLAIAAGQGVAAVLTAVDYLNKLN